jgi:hypothetical protein
MIMKQTRTSMTHLAVALAFALGVIATAQDKNQKIDLTGTWFLTRTGSVEPHALKSILTLKLEGTKLTGKLSTLGRGDQEIEDGRLAGDTVSFAVTRTTSGGNKVTIKYVGKLRGDIISGTIESPGRGGGDPRKQSWRATRGSAR